MGQAPNGKSWSSLVKVKKDETGQVYFKNLSTGEISPVNTRVELESKLKGFTDSIFPAPAKSGKAVKAKSSAPASASKRLPNGRFAPKAK